MMKCHIATHTHPMYSISWGPVSACRKMVFEFPIKTSCMCLSKRIKFESLQNKAKQIKRERRQYVVQLIPFNVVFHATSICSVLKFLSFFLSPALLRTSSTAEISRTCFLSNWFV